MRCSRDEPTGEKSMSPWPSSDSAPFWSKMTRESVCEETANAIRAGTLALISPVMMSALGRWVASRRWMPTGRDHHQVGELVDHAEDVGQRALPLAHAVAVQLNEAARPRHAHDRVPLLHL